MADQNTIDEIGTLEARIDALAGKATSCRKAMLAARIAMIAGVVWIVAGLFGIVRFDPLHFVAVLTLLMGGVVVYGSNVSTLEETEEGLRTAEARRAALISTMKLRVVH